MSKYFSFPYLFNNLHNLWRKYHKLSTNTLKILMCYYAYGIKKDHLILKSAVSHPEEKIITVPNNKYF